MFFCTIIVILFTKNLILWQKSIFFDNLRKTTEISIYLKNFIFLDLNYKKLQNNTVKTFL